MKKKKIMLKYDVIDGSCIGHFNDRSPECDSCVYKSCCSKLNEKDVADFFPKTEKDVEDFVLSYENK